MMQLDLFDELVAYEPCAEFRIPIEGDRLTCARCRWWYQEHAEANERMAQ